MKKSAFVNSGAKMAIHTHLTYLTFRNLKGCHFTPGRKQPEFGLTDSKIYTITQFAAQIEAVSFNRGSLGIFRK